MTAIRAFSSPRELWATKFFELSDYNVSEREKLKLAYLMPILEAQKNISGLKTVPNVCLRRDCS